MPLTAQFAGDFDSAMEAARFSPRLRVLDHTGNLRLRGFGHFEDYDLVLTTYGTLRNDAADFRDVRFDYLILDEAQAIKNADSVSAKSVRLLQADHRLALSGTPIENHLGELWSLFEFLNPGMLGAASVFKMAHGAARNPDEDTRKLLAHALRPFLLRRTKEQVARELPPKVEQTLYCELDTRQRRLYDQLRDHYRATLLKRVQTGGIGRAKIQILEALLRLRQRRSILACSTKDTSRNPPPSSMCYCRGHERCHRPGRGSGCRSGAHAVGSGAEWIEDFACVRRSFPSATIDA